MTAVLAALALAGGPPPDPPAAPAPPAAWTHAVEGVVDAAPEPDRGFLALLVGGHDDPGATWLWLGPDLEVWRWDGERVGSATGPEAAVAVHRGDRVRVLVHSSYAYASGGTAVRVEVGPPPGLAPPAGAMVAEDRPMRDAVEAWVAAHDPELGPLTRNLGSRSWAARERATQEVRRLGRDAAGGGRVRAFGVLAAALESRDVEARDRARSLAEVLWLGDEIDIHEGED
jgi:hypothetical protein